MDKLIEKLDLWARKITTSRYAVLYAILMPFVFLLLLVAIGPIGSIFLLIAVMCFALYLLERLKKRT